MKGNKCMKILAVGDVVGENGLNKLKEVLPNLKQRERIDFVIVNGENVAGGMGITLRDFKQIIFAGADVVTLGNHTWSKKDVFNIIDDEKGDIYSGVYGHHDTLGCGYKQYALSNR